MLKSPYTPHIHWQKASRHDTNFVVNGGNGGCHNDNILCHQWRQSWHQYHFRFCNRECGISSVINHNLLAVRLWRLDARVSDVAMPLFAELWALISCLWGSMGRTMGRIGHHNQPATCWAASHSETAIQNTQIVVHAFEFLQIHQSCLWVLNTKKTKVSRTTIKYGVPGVNIVRTTLFKRHSAMWHRDLRVDPK